MRKNNTHHDEIVENLYYIYCGGFLMYLSMIGNPLASSRVFVFFKILELVFISYYLKSHESDFTNIFILFFIALSMVLFVKNINSYIEQGDYYSSVNFFNYPYVSVFNKDDIYEYRYNHLSDLLD